MTVCIVLPMLSFIRLAFLEYDRDLAVYEGTFMTLDDVTQVFQGPDIVMIGKLGVFSVFSALMSLSLALLVLLVLAPRRSREGLTIMVGLLTAGFFVPIVIKAYGFATFVQASAATAMLFVGGTFVVLFLAPSLAKLQGIERTAVDATYEYFTGVQRTYYVLQAAAGALLIGLLCSLSMVFYSGSELRQLVTNLTPIGDIFTSMLGVRDQEVGLIAAFLLVMAVVAACISTMAASRLWPSRQA
jgi:hypothetical protein